MIESARTCGAAHPVTTRYVRSILQRLVSASRLEQFAASVPAVELVLTCSPSAPLPVARTTAGRVVLVPRALPALAASEDAIAAVLGHELAHLTLRHPEQLIAASAGPVALSRAQRQALKHGHEREADVSGLRLAVNAGYDPRAAIDHLGSVADLVTRLERAGTLRRRADEPVHDHAAARIERLNAQIRACRYPIRAARTPVLLEVKNELGNVQPH